MKKTVNDCYYIGTVTVNKIDHSYYWNNTTKELQRWNNNPIDKVETLDKNVPFNELPDVFAPMFDGKEIILEDEEPKSEIVPHKPGVHIAKDQLEDGAYYEGKCRHGKVARWDAEAKSFFYWRSKYSKRFVERIRCPEDETQFDTFRAFRKIPIPIKEEDRIP